MVGMSRMRFITVRSHTHALWEIVLNTEGSGVAEIGGAEYPFGPGTILCQPPDIPHTKTAPDGFLDIYLQPSHFPLGDSVDKNGVLRFQDDAGKSFETLLTLAHRVYHTQEPNHQRILDALYEAMYQLLLSWYRRVPQDPEVERLKERMVQSFTDPEFLLADLLNQSPYSIDHLRRRFARATGQSPQAYLTALRIEHAKKLMKQNHLLHYSVSEIGALSGYLDNHYFSRVFKKWTGLSPTEYEKAASGAEAP